MQACASLRVSFLLQACASFLENYELENAANQEKER
jgi:hypothetical protein